MSGRKIKKGLTQEQAGTLLKVRVKIIKDFEDGNILIYLGWLIKLDLLDLTPSIRFRW